MTVSDIAWDADNNTQFYGKNVDMTKILNGTVQNSSADVLKKSLPG